MTRGTTRTLCAAAAAVLVLLAPAAAEARCPATPTAKVFAAFGDPRDYSPVVNGGFETGTGGWWFWRAAVTPGNEPWRVGSRRDARSLTIHSRGVAVSPAFCVGIEHPVFRFFARPLRGAWSGMDVRARWTDVSGRTRETVVASLSGREFDGWEPTRLLPLATSLPLWQADQSLQVRLVFDPEDYGGAWAIDDLYVDPYRK